LIVSNGGIYTVAASPPKMAAYPSAGRNLVFTFFSQHI